MSDQQPRFPGLPSVINGNGAVAHVMRHVCGGVIGYPITPSTEISELFEAARAEGGVNVWGKHPFFFEPEGEHSAQSGALGAALTGGQFISNASSSQGILYAMESHYVTVGKKIGGFVLQVAARVVSKHSLNVMAGHDDVYALLSAGYTILFGSNPQEAADLAAISYRVVGALADPRGQRHGRLLHQPHAQRGAAARARAAARVPRRPGRAHQVPDRRPGDALRRQGPGLPAEPVPRPPPRRPPARRPRRPAGLPRRATPRRSRPTTPATWSPRPWPGCPRSCTGSGAGSGVNALEKGTRQMVPALVDVNNPGLTGPVQNQPDFQAGAVDHRTHFASAVPALVRQAMDEYSELTGRTYAPVLTYDCEDADYVMVGLGSITDDVRAVLPVPARAGPEGRRRLGQDAPAVPRGRAGRRPRRRQGRHRARALRPDRADQPGHPGPVQGPGQRPPTATRSTTASPRWPPRRG